MSSVSLLYPLIPAVPDDLIEPNFDENSLQVLEKRYFKVRLFVDGERKENLKEFIWRVAYDIALAELNYGGDLSVVDYWARKFYNVMALRQFLPNSPTLFNAGLNNGLNYMACFVLPVGDSIEDIGEAVKNQMLVQKAGGGTGFSFSNLRQKGAIVGSTQGIASGPVSFMKIFNEATEQIKQGSTRRGANMAILNVHHPDIEEFIELKSDLSQMQNFNISVGITNEFMYALEHNGVYELRNVVSGKTVRFVEAKEIWNKLIKNAWITGDPGVVFLDRIQDEMTPFLGKVDGTNPCAEQPLRSFEACTLGSINLGAFFIDSDKGSNFDYSSFEDCISIASRFLDNVIDRTPYPLKEIEESAENTRRTGLGVMGYADLLAKMKIIYGSVEAFELTEDMGLDFKDYSNRAQEILVRERGAYPAAYNLKEEERVNRNLGATTIAPTGTISIIASCSSGIEPYYSLVTKRITSDGMEFKQVAGELEELLTEEQKQEVLGKGFCAEFPWYISSDKISLESHVKTQAIWQKYIGNAVSKTINLENKARVEDVEKAYLLAWELGCKGITIYRDGSREGQILTKFSPSSPSSSISNILSSLVHPLVSPGDTYKLDTSYGECYITVNIYEEKNSLGVVRKVPFGVFINIGKSGSDIYCWAEALGRVISKFLQVRGENGERADLRIVIDQLKDIRDKPIWVNGSSISSIPDGVAKVLSNYLEEPILSVISSMCPECESGLVREEGCSKCYNCGYSEC